MRLLSGSTEKGLIPWNGRGYIPYPLDGCIAALAYRDRVNKKYSIYVFLDDLFYYKCKPDKYRMKQLKDQFISIIKMQFKEHGQ